MMTYRKTVKRLTTLGVLLCATVGAMGAVAGTAAAAPNPASPGCYWENAYASPKLWIRQYPSTDAATIYSLSEDTLFWATKYNAYNDGVYWVELSTGGWANVTYLLYVRGEKGYTEAFCRSY
jgi:hypothetical protein